MFDLLTNDFRKNKKTRKDQVPMFHCLIVSSPSHHEEMLFPLFSTTGSPRGDRFAISGSPACDRVRQQVTRLNSLWVAIRRPGPCSSGSPTVNRDLVHLGRHQATETWIVRVASRRPRLGYSRSSASDQDLVSAGCQQVTETWSVRFGG